MRIRIFYEEVTFRLKDWKKIKKLIDKVIAEEGKFSGDLNFIIAGDEYIRKINRQFLNHDWYTDVISFKYDEEEGTNGEIYISVESVKSNALNYKVSYNIEMLRIIIHGVLHICGYDDNSERKKDLMHQKENFWMKKFYREEYGI
ncbi:MAG: rRNA maturation RNase YbeY [Bacteroidales bacterium]